ncbi:MAG: hypothetical protein M3423_09810 [Actinomycetota bacterium]|nr:hypothetical protein [Nocardioidaceae bacterium]MDQ3481601.1 hypothetical protein [Actinomycetota bacterium]
MEAADADFFARILNTPQLLEVLHQLGDYPQTVGDREERRNPGCLVTTLAGARAPEGMV